MPRIARFGPFELDAQTAELRKHGVRIRLHEQPFRILLALLEHPGEVVLREEIRKTLWPNDTVVEFDHSINAAIQRLRTSLSDSAEHPRYVETVARRGYRFVGTVEAAEPELPGKAHPPAVPSESSLDPGDLTGRTLSHFRFIGELGRGGMGVVYRAEDLRLGRQVALKFLPLHVEKCPQAMRERFQQEARAAALLNHPNICTIHGVEELAGQPVIEMELIEGETLAAHLARGPLPIGKALATAVQIAAALEEAHRKGIVHRDLKPANIMLTPAGVKVLDFGLAQVEWAAAAGDGGGGTARYMSPEQASGKTVDSRTDIWAFGVVLFEMLTGKPLFGAARQDEPDWSALPVETPPHVRHLLTLCVRKEPESRLRDIVSARVLLGEPDIAPNCASTIQSFVFTNSPSAFLSNCWNILAKWCFARKFAMENGPQRRRDWQVAVAALIGLLTVSVAWWVAGSRLQPPEVVRISRLTSFPGDPSDPAYSPDGSRIAFSWKGELGDAPGIYVMPANGQNPAKISQGLGGGVSPCWSPDGKMIAFARFRHVRDGELVIIPAAGGEERVIVPFQLDNNVYDGARPLLAWTPHGESIIYTAREKETGRATLYLIDKNGEHQRPLLTSLAGTTGFAEPAVSPDGKWLAYATSLGPFTGYLQVTHLDAGLNLLGEAIRVSPAGQMRVTSPTWSPGSDRLLFSQGSSVLEWTPSHAVRGVYTSANTFTELSFTWDRGKLSRLITTEASSRPELRALSLENGRVATGGSTPFADTTKPQAYPRFSPDGKSVAFVSGRSGSMQVWVTDREGRNARQLSNLPDSITGYVAWSPAGDRIAVHSRVAGRGQIFVLDVARGLQKVGDGTKQISHSPVGLYSPAWSPDGQYLYVHQGERDLQRLPAAGGEPEDLCEGDNPVVAADGHRLLYDKVGHRGIFSRSLDGDIAGNPEERVVEDFLPPGSNINPFADGFYYIGRGADDTASAIRFYQYADRKSIDIYPLPDRAKKSPVLNLAVSPNRDRLIFQQLGGDFSGFTLIQFR